MFMLNVLTLNTVSVTALLALVMQLVSDILDMRVKFLPKSEGFLLCHFTLLLLEIKFSLPVCITHAVEQ